MFQSKNGRDFGSYTFSVKLAGYCHIGRSFYINKNTVVEGSNEEDGSARSARTTKGTRGHKDRDE
jgi:hypothetical protein